MEDGDQILPFMRMFHGSPSTYLWEDELGNSQSHKGSEGSKATPSCHSAGEIGAEREGFCIPW